MFVSVAVAVMTANILKLNYRKFNTHQVPGTCVAGAIQYPEVKRI